MPSEITGESALVLRGEKAVSNDLLRRTLKATYPIFGDIALTRVRQMTVLGAARSYANFAPEPAPKHSEVERRQ